VWSKPVETIEDHPSSPLSQPSRMIATYYIMNPADVLNRT